MVPIVSVVGRSNAGKTTFLEKLIAELSSRGWRVGTIKHDAHEFEIDRPGKDSWRHARAGSRAVAIASSTKLAVIKELTAEMTIDELAAHLEGDIDIVLTEGYGRGDKPKIEVSRRAAATPLVSSPDELVALVTDHRHQLDVPHFELDDAAGVADLLESRFLRPQAEPEVSLLVDGRGLPVEATARRDLDRRLREIVAGMGGPEPAREIKLALRFNRTGKRRCR